MSQNFMQLAFTESVKAEQEKFGSRNSYQKMEDRSPDQSSLSIRETHFIEQRDGFYLSTVGENGWPYVQFRGGPKGFLKTIDAHTLAYADFRGNMQYISSGNMHVTKKQPLFCWITPVVHASRYGLRPKYSIRISTPRCWKN